MRCANDDHDKDDNNERTTSELDYSALINDGDGLFVDCDTLLRSTTNPLHRPMPTSHIPDRIANARTIATVYYS